MKGVRSRGPFHEDIFWVRRVGDRGNLRGVSLLSFLMKRVRSRGPFHEDIFWVRRVGDR